MSLFQCKEKDGTLNLNVAGYLTKEPRTFEKEGRVSMVVFSVCYGQKKYMDCKVPYFKKELLELAQCLEAHDTVDVKGVYETYKGKDGKEYGQISVDFIAVQQQAPEGDEGGEASDWKSDGFAEIPPEEQEEGELPF